MYLALNRPPAVSIDVRENTGVVAIRAGAAPDVEVFLPIVKNRALDEPEGFCPDALTACTRYVPAIKGFATALREKLAQVAHRDVAQAVAVLDFTRENLLYGLFDADNPGHAFVLIQCFGGLWGGIAAQLFAAVLLEECTKFKCAMEARSGVRASPSKEVDMVMAILASICKAFGCSARTPIIPRYPQGAPPDPVVLLADAIASRHPQLKKVRDDLIRSLRDWHIPRYMRSYAEDAKLRQHWLPQNQVDRTRAFMETLITRKSCLPLFQIK